MAGVVGVTPEAITLRLRGSYLCARWLAYKAQRGRAEDRAKKRRHWWRTRLQRDGIDPLKLDPTDPTWAACWRMPRGHDVREAAAALRAAGADLRTPAGIVALLDAVGARVAARVGAARPAPGEPPAVDGT